MKKDKTTDELLKEFLANGGEVKKIPAIPHEVSLKVNSTAKTTVELLTLAEGEELFAAKKKTNAKAKQPDYSGINMDLIPDHIKSLIKYKGDMVSNKNNGGQIETNKNSRSSEAGDKS